MSNFNTLNRQTIVLKYNSVILITYQKLTINNNLLKINYSKFFNKKEHA